MTASDIGQRRLIAQHLIEPTFKTPKEAVAWFGAMQAQDYAAAQWAIGQRMRRASEATMTQALADGSIIRTHTMRGTWHMIAPEDLRWFLALTGRRQLAKYAHYLRQLGLDDALLNRGRDALIRALEGGRQLTRRELEAALEQAGITVPELGSTFVLMHGESEGVIASGERRGKQFTYRLVDEFVPAAPTLERDEALAKIVERYFTSHGPAMIQDFVWWTGLTAADTRIGLEVAKTALAQETIDGKTYWFSPALPDQPASSPVVHLLPAFDEYTVAYRDRSAVQHPLHIERTKNPFINLGPIIVVDGRVVGTWKRTLSKRAVTVALTPFAPLTNLERAGVEIAARRYGEFLDLPVILA